MIENLHLAGGGGSHSLAFTLSEVLITLAIIGVVAALTIPTVVRNYQKTQTVTQLKKAYSALANTTNLAIAEHGPITGWEIRHYEDGGLGNGSIEFANKYLLPYLKVSKNCENNTIATCKFEWSYLNDRTPRNLSMNNSRFYLTDGTLIGVASYNYQPIAELQKYAVVYIDINGQKKPNTYGKDIFIFMYWIYHGTQNSADNGKFMPYGNNLSIEELKNGNSYGCNKNSTGEYCSALIMKQGWQIKDDYPWN